MDMKIVQSSSAETQTANLNRLILFLSTPLQQFVFI